MSDFIVNAQGLQLQLLLQFAVGSRAISGSTPPPQKLLGHTCSLLLYVGVSLKAMRKQYSF
jgi:hypothetical protein